MTHIASVKRRLLTASSRLFGSRQPLFKTNQLDVRQAYSLWASTYHDETATSSLDEELATGMLRDLPQTRLLDAGCGVGRRIASIPNAVGIDLSPEMLAAGQLSNVVTGDVRAMPFHPAHFDMVWCRLVIGHVPDPFNVYLELARVCKPGGYIFVTDFHPDAAAAGHRRTFADLAGAVHEIEHYVHKDHTKLAARAGLVLIDHRNGLVGPSIREFYRRGLGIKTYERDLGLKLVAAYLFRRCK